MTLRIAYWQACVPALTNASIAIDKSGATLKLFRISFEKLATPAVGDHTYENMGVSISSPVTSLAHYQSTHATENNTLRRRVVAEARLRLCMRERSRERDAPHMAHIQANFASRWRRIAASQISSPS
jgi:hypothetical protein